MRALLFFLLFFSGFLLFGCSDETTLAPVVNAWYQPSASNYYIVRSDDTVYSIAFMFGLDYRDLVAVNHLSPPYQLKAGERLIMTHRPPMQSDNAQPIYPSQPTVQPSIPSDSAWCSPAKGRLVSQFTTNPSGRPGISIAGQLGDPIYAASSGRVVYSGDGVRGYGNLIIINKNDQYLTAYAFNQHNLVQVGDVVKAGQVIARMGQNDAGHTLLYFEIRQNGVPVDPMKVIWGS